VIDDPLHEQLRTVAGFMVGEDEAARRLAALVATQVLRKRRAFSEGGHSSPIDDALLSVAIASVQKKALLLLLHLVFFNFCNIHALLKPHHFLSITA
jgi:hypothetical protein